MMLSYEGVISYRHTLCDSLAMCPGMFLQQDNSLMREGMGKKKSLPGPHPDYWSQGGTGPGRPLGWHIPAGASALTSILVSSMALGLEFQLFPHCSTVFVLILIQT